MKRNQIQGPFLLFLLLGIIIIINIFSSCMSRKDYRRLDIERLFMQTTKPEIGFPGAGGLQGQEGAKSISEEITFGNSSQELENNEVLANQAQKLDTSKVYKLSEVVIKVRSNFASERDGKVNIDFNIIAPVDILDPNWRLSLAPQLIDGDSICQLDTVIITGEGFRDKQLGDYEAYEDFLTTIVDPSAYDSLYVNWKALNKEIRKVQRRNYNDYRNSYDMMRDYENWKKMNEMEFLSMEALSMRHKKHLYERYWRKSEKLAFNNLKNNKDTLGIHSKYVAKYEKDYVKFIKDRFSLSWLNPVEADINLHSQKDSVLRRSHIPRKYRYIHRNGLTMKDIKAKPFTKEDSIRIAKHHYLIDEIVLNEMNINRKDDIFKEVVEFPFRANSHGVRLDTVISAENDIIYPYKQPWKINNRVRNLKVVLNGRVEGVDRSEFVFPPTDTLTFFIASLSQLADESLVTERRHLRKLMMDKMDFYPEYKTAKSYKFADIKNPEIFDKLAESYKLYTSAPDLVVDSITIQCSTDLLGDWSNNYELSHNRAKAVSDYLRGKFNTHFVVNGRGEDWSALVKEIKARTDMPNASSILDMLAGATYPDQTEDEIKSMYPDDYKIIRNEIYPKLHKMDVYVDISRSGIEKDTIRETYREDYAEAMQLLKNKEYMDALQILAKYGDFNTALALVCMGYNDKAEEVLNSLPQTAKNEYLLAIVCARKENSKKAAEHLITACKLNPDMYNRVSLDAEVNDLANSMNLWPRLNKY